MAWEVAAVNHLCRDGNFRSLLPVIPSEAGASVPIATTPCHSNAPGGLFRSAPSVIIDEVGLLRGWKTALVDPCAGGRNFRQQLSIMTWEAGTSGTNTQKLSITLCEAGASGGTANQSEQARYFRYALSTSTQEAGASCHRCQSPVP